MLNLLLSLTQYVISLFVNYLIVVVESNGRYCSTESEIKILALKATCIESVYALVFNCYLGQES